jgi:hypothetical protein
MAHNASVGLDGSLLLTESPSLADEILLKEPRSRNREFITLVRVMRDFIRGFRVLHFVGPCVTVFGSARIPIVPCAILFDFGMGKVGVRPTREMGEAAAGRLEGSDDRA